jgi:hypothetical protein
MAGMPHARLSQETEAIGWTPGTPDIRCLASGRVHNKAAAADKDGVYARSPLLWRFCGSREAKRCKIEKVSSHMAARLFPAS